MLRLLKSIRSVWLLLPCLFVLVPLWGCVPENPFASSDASIVGVWTREQDAYQGWVIEIFEIEPGEFEARSLWVPDLPRFTHSFQSGEKKMRQISTRSDGTFTLESLSRQEDGTPYYTSHEATLSTPNRLILIDEAPNGGIGDKQVWRRVARGDVENAYADCGRAKIAAERELFSQASTSYTRAARRLLKESDPKAHHKLANSLGWDLATTRHEELYNPELAKQLLPALTNYFNELDTAAAIHAANGDFDKATVLQSQAMTEISSDDARVKYLRYSDIENESFLYEFAAGMVVGQLKPGFEKRAQLYKQRQAYRE